MQGWPGDLARTSLPQIPVASTLTNTSSSPTGGMGVSRISTVNALKRTQDLFVVILMVIVSSMGVCSVRWLEKVVQLRVANCDRQPLHHPFMLKSEGGGMCQRGTAPSSSFRGSVPAAFTSPSCRLRSGGTRSLAARMQWTGISGSGTANRLRSQQSRGVTLIPPLRGQLIARKGLGPETLCIDSWGCVIASERDYADSADPSSPFLCLTGDLGSRSHSCSDQMKATPVPLTCPRRTRRLERALRHTGYGRVPMGYESSVIAALTDLICGSELSPIAEQST